MNDMKPSPSPRLGWWRQFLLSFYWLAVNAQWSAILTILVQSQVLVMVDPERKGRAVGLVMGIGAIAGILVPPLLGALSDRVMFRMGRRRPFMLVGTAVNLLALAGMAYFPFLETEGFWGFTGAYWLFALAFLVANFFSNVAMAPYSALLPDIVPVEQRGSASGWYGLMTTLGNGVGVVIAGSMVSHEAPLEVFQQQIFHVYLVLGVFLVVGVLATVLGTPEKPLAVRPKPLHWKKFLGQMVDPFRSPDFFWVFFTRLLVTMGLWSVQNFLQFFMKDVVRDFSVFGHVLAKTPEEAVEYVLVLLLLFAVPASFIGGKLSDRYGRKAMVYVSGGLQGLVCLGFILLHDYTSALVIGMFFGIGYGAYESVDWALACDVLPNPDAAAKDMGLWHISLTLPQLVAVPLAGYLLDIFQNVGETIGASNLGYTIIFSVAGIYFGLGTLLVGRIKKGDRAQVSVATSPVSGA